MQLPKISLKWILPIILVFLISSTLISLNIQNSADEDIPEDRPTYMLSSANFPEGWHFDLEREIDGKYFLQIGTEEAKAFSIEIKEFVSESEARTYVDEAKQKNIDSGLELRFYESQPKVEMVGADNGFNWEIKSPCCYSRGVTYSIDTYYIYIFGSQDSKWDDIDLLFREQTRSMLQYLGADIPARLQPESNSSLPLPWVGIVLALVSLPLLTRFRAT